MGQPPTRIYRCLTLLGSAVAFAVAVAALGSAVGIPELPEPLAALDRRLPGVFRLHMVASGLGLVLLPWIIAARSRPTLHRRLGRIGAVLLLVGAVASLPAALESEAVLLARLGFLTQGVLCVAFLAGAVWAIRARNIGRHARFMVLAGATILGAVNLRIMMAVAAILGLPFDAAYAAIAWLSWALPLAIVPIWLSVQPGQRLASRGGVFSAAASTIRMVPSRARAGPRSCEPTRQRSTESGRTALRLKHPSGRELLPTRQAR